MVLTQKLTNIIFLIFISIISLQCTHKKKFNKNNFKNIEKTLNKIPINERLLKWDSLIEFYHSNQPIRGYFLFDKANDLVDINENNKAIDTYKKALLIFQRYQIKDMEAKTLVNMAGCYTTIGKKVYATENLIKALNIVNKLNDNYIMSRLYNKLAHLYYLNRDYKKSINFLEKANIIYKKMNDSSAISATYNNISLIYDEQNNFNEAYENALKALEIDSLINNDIGLIENYNNLGTYTYKYLKDKPKAHNYFIKSLELAKKLHVNPAFIYKNLSDLYNRNRQYDSAIYYINLVLKLPEENLKHKIDSYNKALELSIKTKNKKEALSLMRIKDSLQEEEYKRMDHENNKNIENGLALIDKQKQLIQIKQLNQKNRVIFIFIIITFLLGLFISYQLNKMDRLALEQERYILESKVLRSQMNPHLIFNVLSSIQNSLFENKPMVSATYLSKFAKLIRQNFDYIQKKLISLKEELEMVDNYIDTQKFRYKDKFSYKIIIDENVDNDVLIPPMILQPFVENAIEHGFKNIDYQGQLILKIYKKNKNRLCFEIIDNGVGFSPKKDDKEHALDIFRKRLKLLGKEAIESFEITNLEKGTKVSFCIPVK
ncbi:MAG TPA: tetratricopeptide repeat protein [Flavobacteriales bacterium]|nr:tetratricopeptide repeat protein [Flavobacteriales bacterium]